MSATAAGPFYWVIDGGSAAHLYRDCLGRSHSRAREIDDEERWLMDWPICLRCELRRRAEGR